MEINFFKVISYYLLKIIFLIELPKKLILFKCEKILLIFIKYIKFNKNLKA